jgi:hypothetical protein
MADRSDEARLRAEANFKKKQQRSEEGEKVWAEHLSAGKTADANRAKLKAERLARDAAGKPSTPEGTAGKEKPPGTKGGGNQLTRSGGRRNKTPGAPTR